MSFSLELRPIASPACALAVVAAVASAGCGGAGTLDRGKLEREVRTQLSKSVGQQAPKVSCPHELSAEEGATTRCSMQFPDGRLGVSVKVTSLDGGQAKLDIEADKHVQGSKGS